MSNTYNSLRLGLGFEKNPFIEAGFSRLAVTDKRLNSGSLFFYAAGQLCIVTTASKPNYLYGGKIGIETAWMVGMLAVEVAYLTTGTNSQWFFTPRMGLSLLGSASLLYGMSLPTKSNIPYEIGRNQFPCQ